MGHSMAAHFAATPPGPEIIDKPAVLPCGNLFADCSDPPLLT
jgi:hypothetical protein